MQMATEYAIYGLAKLEAQDAVPALIERLGRPIPNLNVDTLEIVSDALGRLKAHEAVDQLVRELTSILDSTPPDEAIAEAEAETATHIIRALLRIGDLRAADIIQRWKALGQEWRARLPQESELKEMQELLSDFEKRVIEERRD
jgi:HEAT repeat protein